MPKMEKIEKVFTLPGCTGVATMTIVRMQQERPHHGDDVIVQAKVMLPTIGQSVGILAPELQFGERLSLLGEELSADWGHTVYDSSVYQGRSRSFDVTRTTWKAAFQAAEKESTIEIEKLVAMLSARQQALVDAENEE